MCTLAKSTLVNRAQLAQLAEAFTKGSTATSTKATKIFHASEGCRRLTINLRENIQKKIWIKAIEQDCTVTVIVAKLLEREVKL